jgi:hypothetical protein
MLPPPPPPPHTHTHTHQTSPACATQPTHTPLRAHLPAMDHAGKLCRGRRRGTRGHAVCHHQVGRHDGADALPTGPVQRIMKPSMGGKGRGWPMAAVPNPSSSLHAPALAKGSFPCVGLDPAGSHRPYTRRGRFRWRSRRHFTNAIAIARCTLARAERFLSEGGAPCARHWQPESVRGHCRQA